MSDTKKILTQEDLDRLAEIAKYNAVDAACYAFEAEFDEVRRLAAENNLILNVDSNVQIWAQSDANGWRSSGC